VSAQTSEDRDDLCALLGLPALSPLAADIRVAIGPTRDAAPGFEPFLVPEPGVLVLARVTLGSRTAGVHLRHGLELAWLLGEPGVPRPVAGLLAARAAALFLKLEPLPIRKAAEQDPWLRRLGLLGGACPEPTHLSVLWGWLSRYQTGPFVPLEPRMLGPLAEVWPLAGPIEHLLTTGGDTRLDIDHATGLNRYGCAPRPSPGVVSFASCTASSISEGGFRAAEATRRRVLGGAFRGSASAALSAQAQAIRGAILRHYDVAELAEAVLAPSGTDAALLMMGLFAAGSRSERVTSILVSPFETGGGIPAVARGRHFADRTAEGLRVARGATVTGFPPDMALATIALRAPDGTPLEAAEVDAAAAAAAASASHAVLHMVDGSKTGLAAPTLATAVQLAGRHAGALDVVVDACQARLDPERLRLYLRLGWPVLLTGSKFFGGPPFSGAILLPRDRLPQARAARLPEGLADYLGGDPARLTGLGGNLGLALRWAAALAEMDAFAAAPSPDFAALLDRLGSAVPEVLGSDRRVRLVPALVPVPRSSPGCWSDRQTIFTFMVRDPLQPARWLPPSALDSIAGWMNADLSDRLPTAALRGVARQRHHIGQPVTLGSSPGGPIGGLRIAFGARLLEAANGLGTLDAIFPSAVAELNACVAKLSLVLDRFPDLAASAA